MISWGIWGVNPYPDNFRADQTSLFAVTDGRTALNAVKEIALIGYRLKFKFHFYWFDFLIFVLTCICYRDNCRGIAHTASYSKDKDGYEAFQDDNCGRKRLCGKLYKARQYESDDFKRFIPLFKDNKN